MVRGGSRDRCRCLLVPVFVPLLALVHMLVRDIASVLPTFRVFITTARALYLLNCGLTLFLIINNAVTWNYVTLIKQNKTKQQKQQQQQQQQVRLK